MPKKMRRGVRQTLHDAACIAIAALVVYAQEFVLEILFKLSNLARPATRGFPGGLFRRLERPALPGGLMGRGLARAHASLGAAECWILKRN